MAVPGKTVKIVYEGCFPDGRVFDKNQNRRRPLKFRVGEIHPPIYIIFFLLFILVHIFVPPRFLLAHFSRFFLSIFFLCHSDFLPPPISPLRRFFYFSDSCLESRDSPLRDRQGHVMVLFHLVLYILHWRTFTVQRLFSRNPRHSRLYYGTWWENDDVEDSPRLALENDSD